MVASLGQPPTGVYRGQLGPGLFSGQPAWHWVWQLLVWVAIVLVIFVPLSVRQYRRM